MHLLVIIVVQSPFETVIATSATIVETAWAARKRINGAGPREQSLTAEHRHTAGTVLRFFYGLSVSLLRGRAFETDELFAFRSEEVAEFPP